MATSSGRKRKTLADELAELVNPAPLREADPEAYFDEGAVLNASDDELQPEDQTRRPVAEGQRMRGDLVVEDAAYRGRKTTRADMFGVPQQDDEPGTGSSDDDEDGEDEGTANGFEDGDEAEDEDSEGGEEDDGEEDEAGMRDAQATAAPKRSLQAQGNGFSGAHSDEDNDHADDGDDGWGDKSAAAAAFARQNDPELSRLQKEYEELQAEDVVAADALRQRGVREAAKGAAVTNQLLLFDRALENRILIQKCLVASHLLPRPEGHRAVLQASPEAAERFEELRGTIVGTLEELLQLQGALLVRNAAICGGTDPATAAAASHHDPRASAPAASTSTSEQLWPQIEARHLALAPYRDSALDRWHRRTVLSSGSGALRNGLRALNQSVTTQVSAIMRDPSRFLQRTRLPSSSCPRPLCEPVEDAATAAAAAAKATAAAAAPVPPLPQRSSTIATDAYGAAEQEAEELREGETFDDAEFYQQLLKEFLQKGPAGVTAAAGVGSRTNKKRKAVDRRASKGRKIRYTVQEKLVNFMAPVSSELPPFAAQLFANLFGHAGKA